MIYKVWAFFRHKNRDLCALISGCKIRMKKFKALVTLVWVGLGENSAEFNINHTKFMKLDLSHG